jgi:protein MpaA
MGLLLLLLLAGGCDFFRRPRPIRILSDPTVTADIRGFSVNSRPIECYTFGTGPETILVLGAIHGDEPASKTLAEGLIRNLQFNRSCPDHLRILILPLCNPDGLAKKTRHNASEIDLNRNFPADNRIDNIKHGTIALTEPESRLLYDLIVAEKPSRILTIHQPYGCIDYDGPADRLAKKMGWFCPLPVRRIGALPGSLGAWAGETMNIPIITLELTADDSSLPPHRLWAKYALTLWAFIEGD